MLIVNIVSKWSAENESRHEKICGVFGVKTLRMPHK